eukprot:FR740305.1.p1 GENE.FR740305.1~~FR740305.1.p1  ORF type:complete len:172 (+),score=11.44 FR740305.1:201-716(+)
MDIPSVIGDLADAIETLALTTDAAPNNIYVWGHSLGGLAGALLATSRRSMARGFILSNPTVHSNFFDEASATQFETMDPDAIVLDYAVMESSCVFRNKDFMRWWTTDPDISPHFEAGMPFKALYCAGAYRAISTVRTRLDKWASPSLILRGGADVAHHEQHGTADLWREAR